MAIKICRYCGQIIDRYAQNCEFCGRYLMKPHDNPDLVCIKCKAPVNTDDNFCQKCGAIFKIPENNEDEHSIQHNIAGIPYHIGILLTSFAVAFAVTVFCNVGKETIIGGDLVFFSIAFVVSEILLYIYFLPSIIAIENNHTNACLIYVCNLLLGVTVVGWFVALVLALQSNSNKRF